MKKKLEFIFKHFGINAQRRKLNEETFELQEAIQNFENGNGNVHDIISEMADVYVMIEEFRQYYEITNDELLEEMMFKINRTIDRIKGENNVRDK